MTIYEYLISVLEKQNKTIDDIKWIGCSKFQIEIKPFLTHIKERIFNGLNLDLPYDLIIVGNDFWLEINDDADKLEYKTLPQQPLQKTNLRCFSTSMIDMDNERIQLDLNNEDDLKLYLNINLGQNTLETLSQYTTYKKNQNKFNR